MNRIVVAVAVGWAALSGGFLVDARAEFRAGAAVADITPQQWPLHLRGSFNPREAESAHDPLFVRALVLDDGTISVALVVVDSCMVGRDVLDQAKSQAAKATGIPMERMLIAATHTHSAPFSNAAYGTVEEMAYQQHLIRGIGQSIVEAHGALQPAEAGWAGQDEPEEVFNRRWFLKPGTMPVNPFGETTDLVKMNPGRGPNLINPAGPVDPEVAILSVRNVKGQPISLLANYPLHYVGRIPGGQVSADYFGEFARLIGVRLRRTPETGFVGILSNGTSGDINNINFRNPRPPREPFEQIRIVAGKVADAAYRAYTEVEHRRELVLGMEERLVTLDVRVPTVEEIARSNRYLAAPEDDPSVPRLARHYARRILEQVEMGPTVEIKLQALRIGDLAICAIPFEVLVEIGLELKEKSPFGDTFIMELANGAYGYLPTPEQRALGGYETWLCTNKVEKDSSVVIVRELLEMMNRLR